MRYKRMVENARQRGIATERAMFASIDRVDELLSSMKESHPEEYWKFIRKTHEDLYGSHYDEEYAEYDISKLHYTDKEGHVHNGGHWSKDEVVTAWQGKVFPSGTTDCDKWVAANVMYSDMCKVLSEEDVLCAAFVFFFADEDFEWCGKIWRYMCAMK